MLLGLQAEFIIGECIRTKNVLPDNFYLQTTKLSHPIYKPTISLVNTVSQPLWPSSVGP